MVIVTGIVIREMPYKETSKIITLLTRELGKISVMVLGAHRPKSRKGSLTQKYCAGYFDLNEGRQFYYLQDVRLIQSFYGIRCNLKRLAIAEVALELIDRTYGSNTNQSQSFSILYSFLKVVNQLEANFRLYIVAFIIKWLSVLGYRPELTACVNCGSVHYDEMYFSIPYGGLICNKCKGTVPGRAISVESIQVMVNILFTPFKELYKIKVDFSRLINIQKVLYRYLQYHLEITHLSSLKVCEELMNDGK